jgi:hypothetical protein
MKPDFLAAFWRELALGVRGGEERGYILAYNLARGVAEQSASNGAGKPDYARTIY